MYPKTFPSTMAVKNYYRPYFSGDLGENIKKDINIISVNAQKPNLADIHWRFFFIASFWNLSTKTNLKLVLFYEKKTIWAKALWIEKKKITDVRDNLSFFCTKYANIYVIFSTFFSLFSHQNYSNTLAFFLKNLCSFS